MARLTCDAVLIGIAEGRTVVVKAVVVDMILVVDCETVVVDVTVATASVVKVAVAVAVEVLVTVTTSVARHGQTGVNLLKVNRNHKTYKLE